MSIPPPWGRPAWLIEQVKLFRYPLLWEATTTAVSPASLDVDGADHPALQIDTDPFVYSVGFRIDEQVVCTTVIPGMRCP